MRALVVIALFAGAALSAAAQTQVTTPQGAAAKVCGACHSLQVVMDTPRDYDAWHDTVQSMIDRGARGTPDEFDLVMQFLLENVMPVDVNHADADTLMAVLHAPRITVDAIIARRVARPFKSLAELEAIPGVDSVALESKKRMIFFQ